MPLRPNQRESKQTFEKNYYNHVKIRHGKIIFKLNSSKQQCMKEIPETSTKILSRLGFSCTEPIIKERRSGSKIDKKI